VHVYAFRIPHALRSLVTSWAICHTMCESALSFVTYYAWSYKCDFA